MVLPNSRADEQNNDGIYDNNEETASDSSSCCYADIGFMFEGSEQPSKSETFTFRPTTACVRCHRCDKLQRLSGENSVMIDETTTVAPVIQVALNAVDDYPGALQSGHYLWPAAPALVQYLVDFYLNDICASCTTRCNRRSPLQGDDDGLLPKEENYDVLRSNGKINIVELGAGCGLGGVAAVQIFSYIGKGINSVVFTDHDPGTLQRARRNYEETLNLLHEIDPNLEKKIQSVPVLFESLSWGDTRAAKALKDRAINGMKDESKCSNLGFDIVLGSDLVYCKEVVRPLLCTAFHFLSPFLESNADKEHSLFLMAQSFPYTDDTEEEIDLVCDELGLARVILYDKVTEGGVRVQRFTSKDVLI